MSLINRVSLAFLAVIALILAGFSFGVYTLTKVRLLQGVDLELNVRLSRIEGSFHSLEDEVDWMVINEWGAPVEGSDEFLHHPPFSWSVRNAPLTNLPHTLVDRDGNRWRVLVHEFSTRPRVPNELGDRTGEQNEDDASRRSRDRVDQVNLGARRGLMESKSRRFAPGRWIVTGTRLNTIETALAAVAKQLVGLSVGLWLIAAFLGRSFGHHALVPFVRIASAAATMTNLEESRSLPSPGTGDELEAFVSSFNDLLERLHESLSRQKQFAGQASHQLRTPLAGIISEIEVARRRPREISDLEQVLDHIHDDALRLTHVVESLLFLARADADAAMPQLIRMDLSNWLTEYRKKWSDHPRNGDLEFNGEGPNLTIQAHPALLEQLCDNLLDNAFKYSNFGSSVRVRASRDSRGVSISVEDIGMGISAADIPHIFDPFYRSDTAQSGVAGVGLGLAVVQRIANAFGADIKTKSEPGHGTKLTVIFAIPGMGLGEATNLSNESPED